MMTTLDSIATVMLTAASGACIGLSLSERHNYLRASHWALIAIALGTLAGCADRRPTCAGNPRNMQCFSAGELQKELNQ